jgi:DNA-binding PadR family transcriptional regulator
MDMAKAKRIAPADADECPCAGSYLDKFIQPAILAVLTEGPLHGYSIVQRLGETPICQGDKPDTAGVYRHLKILEDRSMVTSSWHLSVSGPARKLFTLTPGGRKCLSRWAGTLEEYHRSIGALADKVRQASASPSRSKPCGCDKG